MMNEGMLSECLKKIADAEVKTKELLEENTKLADMLDDTHVLIENIALAIHRQSRVTCMEIGYLINDWRHNNDSTNQPS